MQRAVPISDFASSAHIKSRGEKNTCKMRLIFFSCLLDLVFSVAVSVCRLDPCVSVRVDRRRKKKKRKPTLGSMTDNNMIHLYRRGFFSSPPPLLISHYAPIFLHLPQKRREKEEDTVEGVWATVSLSFLPGHVNLAQTFYTRTCLRFCASLKEKTHRWKHRSLIIQCKQREVWKRTRVSTEKINTFWLTGQESISFFGFSWAGDFCFYPCIVCRFLSRKCCLGNIVAVRLRFFKPFRVVSWCSSLSLEKWLRLEKIINGPFFADLSERQKCLCSTVCLLVQFL